jgi:hypothetical protein
MRHRAVKRPNRAPFVKHRSENHDIRGYGTRSIKTPKRKYCATTLRDMGLTPEDRQREINKAFWQG